MDNVGDGVATAGRAVRPGRAALVLGIAGMIAVAQGCATAPVHSETSNRPAVRAAEPAGPKVVSNSVEDLTGRVLAGLADGNLSALAATMVSKDEFCSRVFPELPSSKVNNVNCDFVWEMAMLNHASGLNEVYGQHKGKRYTLVSVRFEGEAQRYPSFRVLKRPLVTVRDENGKSIEHRLFGDVLEIDGQFKLFGFMVD